MRACALLRTAGVVTRRIDPALTRFSNEPDEDRQEEFRGLLLSYIRLYGFLSQIASFGDPDREKLYAFTRLLRTKLPKRQEGGLTFDQKSFHDVNAWMIMILVGGHTLAALDRHYLLKDGVPPRMLPSHN